MICQECGKTLTNEEDSYGHDCEVNVDYFEHILEQYTLGNFSQLDKHDLIRIAKHFEEISKGELK